MIRKTDISHFRAPYKDWPSLQGFGADPVMDAFFDVVEGILVFKPASVAGLQNMLGQFLVQPTSDPKVMQVVAGVFTQGPAAKLASQWAGEQFGQGRAVLMTKWGPLPIGAGGMSSLLRVADSYAEIEKYAAAKPDRIFAVLAAPPEMMKPNVKDKILAATTTPDGKLSTVGIVAIVAGAAGLGYLVLRKKHAKPNGWRRRASKQARRRWGR